MARVKLILLVLFLMGINIIISSQDSGVIKADFETAMITPERVFKIDDGHYFIDFGKAYFGTVEIKSRINRQSDLVLHLAEKLSSANHVDRNPAGTIRYQSVIIPELEPDRLVSIDLIRNINNSSPPAIILPDSFGIVMPFRYCEIENLEGSINDVEIWQKIYHYKFNDELSAFTSSDTVLNAIWELCKHSIKATSFAGYYIDGDRERIPYEADAYINQLSHYSIDTVYSLARRTNEYFIDHPTWPTEWILHTGMMFYTDYQYTGDKGPLIKHYESLKFKTLMELSHADGLISTSSKELDDKLMSNMGFGNPKRRIRDIVDWPSSERDNYEMVEVNTVVNAFYYQNLRIMALIAGVVGEKEDSLFYSEKANEVQQTINDKLFDKSKGIYIDGEGSDHSSLHANMFPLAFGIVPEENIAGVVDFIKSKGMACSVYAAQYLLEALVKNGESGYAIDLIRDTNSDRSWWNMIESGSTITLEAWDIKYKPNLDWNHAWGSAPLNILTRQIWGITPLTPGFSTAQIKPQLNELEFSSIKVPTIEGVIFASYKKVKNKYMIYRIEIPQNMKADFISQDIGANIKLNRKKVRNNQSVVHLKGGLNTIEIRN